MGASKWSKFLIPPVRSNISISLDCDKLDPTEEQAVADAGLAAEAAQWLHYICRRNQRRSVMFDPTGLYIVYLILAVV